MYYEWLNYDLYSPFYNYPRMLFFSDVNPHQQLVAFENLIIFLNLNQKRGRHDTEQKMELQISIIHRRNEI